MRDASDRIDERTVAFPDDFPEEGDSLTWTTRHGKRPSPVLLVGGHPGARGDAREHLRPGRL